jgi:hypothetical protein
MAARLYNGDTFELGAYTFRVEFRDDDNYRPEPWTDGDGYGIISDWRKRDDWRGNVSKAPGERVLCEDGRQARFYDVAATMKKARAEGWGCGEHKHATDREACACAVERDYEHWRRYCEGQWNYVGVVVTLLDDDDEPTDETESLWGIESDCTDYLTDMAHELAREILSRVEVDEPDVMVSEN